MRGFIIVVTGLLLGNYDSAGPISDSNALKTSKSTLPSVRTSQKTPCVPINNQSATAERANFNLW